MTQEVVYLWDN